MVTVKEKSNTNNKKPTTAIEFMKEATRIIEIPNMPGKRVKIRKISGLDLLKVGSLMKIPIERLQSEFTRPLARQSTNEVRELCEEIITAGIVEPVVVNKDWSEVDPKKEVHISVFSQDLNHLVAEILRLSGISEEVCKKANTFPDTERDDGTPTVHD